MTDRAAVMKKFDADFLNFIRTPVGQEAVVHFLHCKVHCGLMQTRLNGANREFLITVSQRWDCKIVKNQEVKTVHQVEGTKQRTPNPNLAEGTMMKIIERN